MVAVTSNWMDPAHPDRRALAMVAALAPLLPELDAAWQGLHVTYGASAGTARRKQIQERQRELDLEHDDVVRGIWFYLQAQVFIRREPAERREMERLRDRLLPEGLLAVNKSYREEAGQAELATSRLTDRDRELLASMVAHDDRPLLDLVQRWLELGRQIGALDRERAGNVRDDVPTHAEALAARHRWIRTVSTMRDVAALVAPHDAAIQEALARVEMAERAADRRAASRDTGGESVGREDGLAAGDDAVGSARTAYCGRHEHGCCCLGKVLGEAAPTGLRPRPRPPAWRRPRSFVTAQRNEPRLLLPREGARRRLSRRGPPVRPRPPAWRQPRCVAAQT